MKQNAKAVAVAVGTVLVLGAGSAMAALPADVDTAITAAQTDILAMIGKGFAFIGATAGLTVVAMKFKRVIFWGK